MLSMKDLNGAFVDSVNATPPIGALLDSLGVKTGTEIWGRRLWGSRRESKNGVYDVYLVTRMERSGKDVEPLVSGKVGFLIPEAEHGWIASPNHDYKPMETLLFKVPKLDAGSAGLRWPGALAEIWHPVETVPSSAAPILAPSAEVRVLRDGWTPAAPNFFGTLGWPEETNVTFRTTARVPNDWLDDDVDLVFNCGFVMRGLSPSGFVRVNGRNVPGRAPFKTFRNGGGFVFDVTELAKANGGVLKIEVQIDGATPSEEAKRRPERPNGVGGTFAIVRRPKARSVIRLDGSWYACLDYGVRRAVKPGEKALHRYWEAVFATPKAAGKSRMFLSANVPINGLMLNGRMLNVSSSVRRLDVTGLLLPGKDNTLRWIPDDLHGFSAAGALPKKAFDTRLGNMRLEIGQ